MEDARSIARRFVVSAMSVGALSPEARLALTIGIQRAGGSANTGEGGEDPAWYVPDADGRRRDARVKQVASARFGVTATYLARADQLEIKIAQGSKPGERGQIGRDLLVAALLGAEEFAFGTAALVAVGCDMARQCHLDTCPTGIATQREDLRAKFTGTPEMVQRFFLAVAEDLRRELAAVGARTVGSIVGESRRMLRPIGAARSELAPVVGAPSWGADAGRREDPSLPSRSVKHAPASPLEARVVAALRDQGPVTASGLRLSTADRSFGAGLTGALERGELRGPLRLELRGEAGQSFGAFAVPGVDLTLVGQANDYVGKGLSGGRLTIVPEPDLAAEASGQAVAGNTLLYGATAGRLHLVGRAGMRFAVRNSGAEAVVEGIGPHGCEYMTSGTVVILGAVGANFGAGMTGGRAYLYDPSGRHAAALDTASVGATRLSAILHEREDGLARNGELRGLLEDHRSIGSALAGHLLELDDLPAVFWVVEPIAPVAADVVEVSVASPTPTELPIEPVPSHPAAVNSSQPLV